MKKWHIALILLLILTVGIGIGAYSFRINLPTESKPIEYHNGLSSEEYYRNLNQTGNIMYFNGTEPIVALPKVEATSIEVKIDKIIYFDSIQNYRIQYRQGHYYKTVDDNGNFLYDGYDWSDADWKWGYMFKSTDADGNKREFIDVTIDNLVPDTLYEVRVLAEDYLLDLQQVRTQAY